MAKAPSAWLIEKALAAWRAGVEVAFAPDYRDSDLWAGEVCADGPDVQDILHRLILSAVTAGDMAAMAAQREAEIKQRKERFLAREKALRQIVQGLMEAIGEKKVEFGDVSVTLGAGRESAIITDEAKLPAEYVRETTTKTPDKRLILDDLKEGVVIDGAELSNGGTTLTIRTK